MVIPRNRIVSDRVPTRSMRDAIAVALDGVEPAGNSEHVAAYRTAMAPLSTAMHIQLQQLRQFGSEGFVAASTCFDNMHRLLDLLGVASVPTSAIAVDDVWPGIVFIGCPGNASAAQCISVERMLSRGAVIVSSDAAARVPVISNGLRVATRRPARRARLVAGADVAYRIATGVEWGRLVLDMHPAALLAPGHLPLKFEQETGTRIVAHDALSGDPLVVVAPVGGGHVVHSVPHWWQDSAPDTGELGRRPLASMPAFAELGLGEPSVRLGGFAAASIMLVCLLAGLDVALEQCGRLLLQSSSAVRVSGGGQVGPSA